MILENTDDPLPDETSRAIMSTTTVCNQVEMLLHWLPKVDSRIKLGLDHRSLINLVWVDLESVALAQILLLLLASASTFPTSAWVVLQMPMRRRCWHLRKHSSSSTTRAFINSPVHSVRAVSTETPVVEDPLAPVDDRPCLELDIRPHLIDSREAAEPEVVPVWPVLTMSM